MSVLKEGWITLQDSKDKSLWQRRWFVLKAKELVYSEKANFPALGTIPIDGNTKAAPAPDCEKQPAFKVTSGQTYLLTPDTPKLVQEWVEAINDVKSGKPVPQTEEKKVTTEDFDILRVLGRGTYGKVQLVKMRSNGQIFAMKSMSKKVLADSDQVTATLTERSILLRTRHPFLVGAYYTFQSDAKIFMILDYVPGGELFQRLKEEVQFSESRVRLYAAEIALGLGHLHSIGIIYRDLKPENILVDENGHLKLTDFGLAKEVSGAADTTSTFCGTPEYISPEMLQRKAYTKAVDWWSYGILIFEMLTGLPPFFDDNVNTMYHAIVNGSIDFPDTMSAQAQDFITKLLNRDPKARLGAGPKDIEEIKSHPFFASINWDDVYNLKITPEWIPQITGKTDTSNFDEEFTAEPAAVSFEDASLIDDTVQNDFQGFTCQNDSVI